MSIESRLNPTTPCWKDEYLTGILEIDTQHQQFFAFVAELLLRARTGLIRDDQQEAMAELLNYASHHFATEEEWMRTHSYPDPAFRAHCNEHAGFIDDVKALRARMYQGENIFADLLIFSNGWLITHILETDAQYAQFARGMG